LSFYQHIAVNLAHCGFYQSLFVGFRWFLRIKVFFRISFTFRFRVIPLDLLARWALSQWNNGCHIHLRSSIAFALFSFVCIHRFECNFSLLAIITVLPPLFRLFPYQKKWIIALKKSLLIWYTFIHTASLYFFL